MKQQKFKKGQRVLVNWGEDVIGLPNKVEVKIMHRYSNILREVKFDEESIYLHNGSKCGKRNDRYRFAESLIHHIDKEDETLPKEQEQGKAADIINELTKKHFGIHLVTCGKCGDVISLEKDYIDDAMYQCNGCKTFIEKEHCPDLFY